MKDVEANWQKVRAELDAVMKYRDAMPSFQDIVKEVGMIQGDDQWKTFFLKGVGMDCEENARHCPETMKVLDMIPGCTTGFPVTSTNCVEACLSRRVAKLSVVSRSSQKMG